MNKKTYNIFTFTIGGLVVFGGRYIGLSLLQRIIAFIALGGLFEIIYRKTKKENEKRLPKPRKKSLRRKSRSPNA